ncbi:AMP-binding protein [Bradyrhizobium sp. CCBAU 11430]|uniref:AMP-binding protein n=1 Tax=Bradyrhizobium sp. CCBAU 11430 TaxID=1630881 RepID=UPI002305AC12|nr:AMP-binding protein [Bradyrhizobium sp. CCBAU 11430]
MTTENQSAKKHSRERQPVDATTAINCLAGSKPVRVALRHGADELTYEALRSRSDALATTLREQGARGAIVGCWGELDLDCAIAVIAILKAELTYLPLDPSLPASRTSFMIEQSRCTLLMGRERRPDSLSPFQDSRKAAPQFVAIEAAPSGGHTSSVVPSPFVDGLAYILFTSGSTGQPKGAMIERAGLNNHLAAKLDALSLTQTDCVAQTASHCFVLWQLLSGLCVGASTSIIDNATVRSQSSLLQAIQRCGATIVQLVPSLLAVFVEYLQSLAAADRAMDGSRIVSTIGEPLTPELARAWLALYARASILNHYGPTECVDSVTYHLVSEAPALAEPYVPIGRPIQNVEVYVANGQPQRTTLRLVTSSAEPMPSLLPARWRESFSVVALWNLYGATECASNAAVHQKSDADDNSVLIPVGRPTDNVKLYVVVSRLKRVPLGAPGELCIAGRCPSAGYWRDQDRTDRCFVPNPYDGGQYNVLYRSREIARISTSGILKTCGRSDNQIKVVDFSLEAHPAMAKAAVFAEGFDDDRPLTVPARHNLSSGESLGPPAQ